jgi:nucleotide-binding universal stress UspA family protein
MKLLIAYDGSTCSEAALDDLTRAGMPDAAGVARVMSVAEVWLPPADAVNSGGDENGGSGDANSAAAADPYVENIIERHRERAKKAVAEAEALANHAKQRLQRILPGWQIETEATFGSPAWEVLTRAAEWRPDLIVVGSHGRSAVGRFFLGSISNKILTEAHCSVRVARGKVEVDPPTPARVVIGFDGSAGAQAAIESVLSRNWREESEFRLVAVTDPLLPTAIGLFVPPVTSWVEEEMKTERDVIEKLAESALQSLTEAGFRATLDVHAGNPKKILVEEAESWSADCIFVGANAYGSRLERFLIGSTSAAVAARAHCSVEVVRKQS